MDFSSYEVGPASPERKADERRILRASAILSLIPPALFALFVFFPYIGLLYLWILTKPRRITSFVRRMRQKGLGRRLDQHADFPSAGSQFSAQVRVRYYGLETYHSVGIVTFMQGYLLYGDLRIRFGLRSQDCDALFSTASEEFTIYSRVEGDLPLSIIIFPIRKLYRPHPSSSTNLLRRLHLYADEGHDDTIEKFRWLWTEWRQSEEHEIPNSTYPPPERIPDLLAFAKLIHASAAVGLYLTLPAFLLFHLALATCLLTGVAIGSTSFVALSIKRRISEVAFDRKVKKQMDAVSLTTYNPSSS